MSAGLGVGAAEKGEEITRGYLWVGVLSWLQLPVSGVKLQLFQRQARPLVPQLHMENVLCANSGPVLAFTKCGT